MRIRALIFTLGLTSLGVAVANCGSEDGSQFGDGNNKADGGEGGTGGNNGILGGGTDDDSGSTFTGNCKKLTCADLGANCGPQGDGCGGKIDSCGTCAGQETCGGGGTLSQCGGTAGCVPRTCDDIGVECGPAGDGCGGTLQCGSCTAPEFCGGGGPSKCGGGRATDGDGGSKLPDGGTCVPRTTCDTATNECGPVADGCGHLLICPGCDPASGTTCGGGNVASHCGAPVCNKTTCPLQNADCGFVADGCGGILDCGGANACTVPGQKCGGGGPNKCGTGTDGGTGVTCTNLCLKIPTDCPGGTNTTEITGTVYMPNGTLPVYDALVYVPNGTPKAIDTGTSLTCTACADEATGEPLANTRTDSHGKFTLTNIPYDAAGIPVVIQKGRWRKQITVTGLTRCGSKEISTYPQPQTFNAGNNTTFGSTQTATNNIPKMAVTSGERDSLQCLLRKIGIDDSEFTQPKPPAGKKVGRVNVFHGSGGTSRYDNNFNTMTGTGAWTEANQATRNLPDETYLYGDGTATVDSAHLRGYDAVVLSCTGSGEDRQTALQNYRAEMQDYADKGGHVFASHWHHSWLEYGVAPWGTNPGGNGPIATINHQNDLIKPITATINQGFTKGAALAEWMVYTHTLDGTAGSPKGSIVIGTTGNDDGAQHTINAIDTTRANNWISITKPAQCNSGANCDPPGDGPSPNDSIQYFDFNTPVDQATQCGRFVISDMHVATAASNSGNFPSANCTTGAAATTLTDQERVLAFMLFDLTSCIVPVQPPPPFQCQPLNCAQQGIVCGKAGNGCGDQITCDACPDGKVCQNNACITPHCDARNCAQAGAECGIISNGCGGTVTCPPCEAGVCGGSGPNKCGLNSCTPVSCQVQGIQCGPAGNGCGDPLDCGPCPPGSTCGGGGTPGVCGAPNCTPRDCTAANATCGFIADGCGGLKDCGTCPSGQSCGGGGVANKCGGGGGVN